MKPTLQKSLLYLIVSIPLMFLSPLILSIGFVALKKDGIYLWLIFGALLSLFSILWVVRAIISLLKALEK